MLLCPPQIPHVLILDGSYTAMVRGQGLTTEHSLVQVDESSKFMLQEVILAVTQNNLTDGY
jgi:hypothetical protein